MQTCQKCIKQRFWRRTGKYDSQGAAIMKCSNCGHEQAEAPPQAQHIPASVLYFDIETALLKTTLFAPGQQWIRWEDVEGEYYVLCWAAMWMQGDGKPKGVISDCITPSRVKRLDDSVVLRKLHTLMCEADYVVGHNMRPFDWKLVSGRFITLGWDAPPDAKIVDTLSLSRRRYRVKSHALDSWEKRLGLAGKHHMEREDWVKCIGGDTKALDKMHRYCRDDVRKGVKVTREFQRYIEQATNKLLFR